MGEQFISVLDKPKVFCIGLDRTGTRSLACALENMGYSVTGQNGPIHRPRIERAYKRVCIRTSYNFDAFYGNPWPLAFQEMYQLWPNAKFILTIREPKEWVTSMAQTFGGTNTPIRKLTYGSGDPIGREKQYIGRMLKHEKAVRNFFVRAPSSLLTMNITAGDGYKLLGSFLNHQYHETDFPHLQRGR